MVMKVNTIFLGIDEKHYEDKIYYQVRLLVKPNLEQLTLNVNDKSKFLNLKPMADFDCSIDFTKASKGNYYYCSIV